MQDLDRIWRVKGSHRLSRPALAILREVWHWRDNEATRANRPPFFIMSHDHLARIAELAAEGKNFSALLPRTMSERRRGTLFEAVEAGRAVPPDQYPKIPRNISRRPSEAERKRYERLQKARDAQASALGIEATLIATRSNLSDLAHDCEKHAFELMSWQRKLLEQHPSEHAA